jgi:hypothetical protein
LIAVGQRPWFRAATILGWVLVGLWGAWWLRNHINGEMLFIESTWVRLPYFGGDFLNGLDAPIRAWFSGKRPYDFEVLDYPPIVLRLFSWAPLVPSQVALVIWFAALLAFGVIGAIAALRARVELGLERIPTSLGIATILFSTSFLFSVERANYDLWIVPLVVGSVFLMKRNDANADVGAALLLALAMWVKLYSGLIVVAVLALRKWRLAAWLTGACVLIALIDVPQMLEFIRNVQAVSQYYIGLWRLDPGRILPWNHPLALSWPALWSGTPLAAIPGWLGSVLVLGPLFCWVTWKVYSSDCGDRLALAYLFWTVALGSFVPPIANDYNLTPLPLAALAAVSTRDPWGVWIGIGWLALWWQPVAVPIPGHLILLAKIAGLIAVGICLVRRAGEYPRTTGDVSNFWSPWISWRRAFAR